MAKLKMGDRIVGPLTGDIFEILAVHEGSEVHYWAVREGYDHAHPTTRGAEIESWNPVPDFFEEGATYKSPYGTIAIIRCVEEIDGRKHAFAHTIDTNGAHSVTTLMEMHYEYWKKQ